MLMLNARPLLFHLPRDARGANAKEKADCSRSDGCVVSQGQKQGVRAKR